MTHTHGHQEGKREMSGSKPPRTLEEGWEEHAGDSNDHTYQVPRDFPGERGWTPAKGALPLTVLYTRYDRIGAREQRR